MADPTTPTDPINPPGGPVPVYAPEEITPPKVEANSFGGGEAAEDEAPSAGDVPGHGSAHEDAGWRAITPDTP